jgi:hypothetical protein
VLSVKPRRAVALALVCAALTRRPRVRWLYEIERAVAYIIDEHKAVRVALEADIEKYGIFVNPFPHCVIFAASLRIMSSQQQLCRRVGLEQFFGEINSTGDARTCPERKRALTLVQLPAQWSGRHIE